MKLCPSPTIPGTTEAAMPFELKCCQCQACFMPDLPRELRTRVEDEGPWSRLGDGETFEDALFSALPDHGTLHCPACGESVPVTEDHLGKMSQAILANW